MREATGFHRNPGLKGETQGTRLLWIVRDCKNNKEL
jgi:hypothetical protein